MSGNNMMRIYNLKIIFHEIMLGHAPADREVYQRFIQAKERARDEAAAEAKGDELASLPIEDLEKSGWSVFHKDEQGLLIYNYMVRGVFKAAAEAVTGTTGMTAYRSKIDKFLFVTPRRIHFQRNGKFITEPDGQYERPIRVMTMQGPRVSLKRSDHLDPTKGEFTLSCRLHIMPLGRTEISEKRLRSWLDYGDWGSGFGEWRSGGFGRFHYDLKLVQEGEDAEKKEEKPKKGQAVESTAAVK